VHSDQLISPMVIRQGQSVASPQREWICRRGEKPACRRQLVQVQWMLRSDGGVEISLGWFEPE
jgi:hypothetical protein